MEEHLRTFGYLCPQCGKPVLAERDAFSLTASHAAIPCPCGGSALKTDYDGLRFHLAVPCGLCGGEHTAVCPGEQLLHKDTALTCPQTGEFDCFIGEAAAVEKRTRDLEILAKQEGEPAAFVNSVVMYEILSELRDIAARPDGITCRCGSRRYRMQVRRSAVDVICASCGGRLRLPAATDEDLDSLCCHMKLVIPGGAGAP